MPSSTRPMPVTLVITKYDVWAKTGRGEKHLMQALRATFPALFERGRGFLTAVCPVSLGMELCEDKLRSPIKPFQIHLPILFAVWAYLRSQVRDGKEMKSLLKRDWHDHAVQVRQLEQEIANIDSDRNMIGKHIRRLSVFLDGRSVNILRA